jgi:hypothetical protein
VLAGSLVNLLILAFFVPLALRGRSLAEGEGVSFYLPLRQLVADAWRYGEWPAWNPYVCAGMPLLADCQAGAFYPLNLLYLWLAPVTAMNAVLLLGQLIAAWGVVFLLRAHRSSPVAAAAGAIVYVYSGFMVGHLGHVSIANAAVWIPWICLAVHYGCTGPRHAASARFRDRPDDDQLGALRPATRGRQEQPRGPREVVPDGQESPHGRRATANDDAEEPRELNEAAHDVVQEPRGLIRAAAHDDAEGPRGLKPAALWPAVTHGHSGWIAVGAVFWAVQFFAGHPQIVIYTGILVATQVAALRINGHCRLRACLPRLAIMTAVAVALCAVQILPTLAMSEHTARNFHPSMDLFKQYRLTIPHTPLLWIPFLFGTQAETPLNWNWWGAWNFVEQAGYVGLLPWMLLPVAAFLPGGRRRMGRSWAVIAGLHLILAWNIDTPVGRLLYHLPIYNAFECAGRHLIGMILALAVTTGIAIDALAEAAPAVALRWSRRGAWAIAGLVAVLVLCFVIGYEYATAHMVLGQKAIPGYPSLSVRPWAQAPWVFLGPLLFAGLSAWALIRYAVRPGRPRVATLLLVLFVDIGSAAYLGAWRWRHEITHRPWPPSPAITRLLSGPADRSAPPPPYILFDTWGPQVALHPQSNVLYRFASLNGYGPLQLRRYQSMVGLNKNGLVRDESLLQSNRALDPWACQYLVVHPAIDGALPAALTDETRYRSVLDEGGLRVYENLRALPHARLVRQTRLLNDAESVLKAITTGDIDSGSALDSAQTALLESRQDAERLKLASSPSGHSPGTIRWLSYGQNHLSLETHCEEPAVLILAEPFLDGWETAIDGQPVTVARADYMLRAVAVPAGTHRITMRYTPPGLRKGLAVSGLGIAGLMVLSLSAFRQSRRPVRAGPPIQTCRLQTIHTSL